MIKNISREETSDVKLVFGRLCPLGHINMSAIAISAEHE
jgi:hypothetical protein